MILSDQDIKYYLDIGKIKIEPLDEKNISPASFVFTLGNKILRPMGSDVIDFRKKLFPDYQEIIIDTAHGYLLNQEEFVLAQTAEKITLSRDLAMIIEGRSYLARTGLEVVQTSTFIEPTHTDSIITLEVKNNGKSPIMLYPGMVFAKGIFMMLKSPYSGQFGTTTYTTQDEVKPPRI